MRTALNACAVVAVGYALGVFLCCYADEHCDTSNHAGECLAEYAFFRRCSLGLDDHK